MNNYDSIYKKTHYSKYLLAIYLKRFIIAFLSIFLNFAIIKQGVAINNTHKFVLDNGMQVLVIENHKIPAVSHMVWYRVGAGDDPHGQSGLAHFLEHLMFKGTENLAAGEATRIIARNGGRENAFTSRDYTAYFQNIAKEHLPLMMEMEADRMANLRLALDDVLSERKVIIEERFQRVENNPEALLREQLMAALHLNSTGGRPIIGWLHEMEELSRQNALDFYNQYYSPSNAILIVAGDVAPDYVLELAKKYYEPIRNRNGWGNDVASTADGTEKENTKLRGRLQEPVHHSQRRLKMNHEQVNQPSLSIAYLAPSILVDRPDGMGGEHSYALILLAHLLGDGMTSHLYKKLVIEQKLASSVYVYYDDLGLEAVPFVIYASPADDVSLEKLEQAINKELEFATENLFAEKDLERAKTQIKAEMIYMQDSLQTMARIYGMVLTSGMDADYLENWPENIAKVSLDDIQKAARALFDDKYSVVGYLEPEEPQEKNITQ